MCVYAYAHNTILGQIIRTRKSIYGLPSVEQQLTNITERLRRCNPSFVEAKANERRKNLKYEYDGVKVCGRFWAMVHGGSEYRMKKVRQLVYSGNTIWVRGNKDKSDGSPQLLEAYAFWHNFFEKHCQQPNNELRLFPVNESFRNIYKTYFVSWYAKRMFKLQQTTGCTVDELPWMPSESTFIRARWDSDFSDVCRRAKHYHCQCVICGQLKIRQLKVYYIPYI